jgi:hypothetical protein
MSLSNIVRPGDGIHVIYLPLTFWSKTRPDGRKGMAGCHSIRASVSALQWPKRL